uniref:SPOC domain-containing protein n=1 Tax=Macrostomum lignano TaxID=282301 RepID=A0A1I8HPK3_9PLAT
IASQSTFSAVAETAAADAATPQSSSIQTDFFVPSMSSAVNSVSAAETSTATVSAATSEFTEPDITAAPPAATSAETGASLGVSESAGTTDSTGSPTGTASAPTTLATCRPKLNLSPNLSPFWVLTVLQAVPSATDVSACQWADDMESLLLTLLTESQALSSTGRSRRRRFAENSSLRLQLVSATRDAGSERVSLVYYAMSAGGAAYLPADSVVSAINGNSARVPVVLGYSVESPAASGLSPSLLDSDFRSIHNSMTV